MKYVIKAKKFEEPEHPRIRGKFVVKPGKKQKPVHKITVHQEDRGKDEKALEIKLNGHTVANAFFTKDKSKTFKHGEWTNSEIRFVHPRTGEPESRVLVGARLEDIKKNPNKLSLFLAQHGFDDSKEGEQIYEKHGKIDVERAKRDKKQKLVIKKKKEPPKPLHPDKPKAIKKNYTGEYPMDIPQKHKSKAINELNDSINNVYFVYAKNSIKVYQHDKNDDSLTSKVDDLMDKIAGKYEVG